MAFYIGGVNLIGVATIEVAIRTHPCWDALWGRRSVVRWRADMLQRERHAAVGIHKSAGELGLMARPRTGAIALIYGFGHIVTGLVALLLIAS